MENFFVFVFVIVVGKNQTKPNQIDSSKFKLTQIKPNYMFKPFGSKFYHPVLTEPN